jgi:gliding motility-associated-like protein
LDTFRTAGTYTIGLRVKDENSCIDVEMKQFRVTHAEPDFTITPNPACFSSGTVQLTNNTDANQIFGDVITKYTWIFGDGSPIGTSTTGLSTLIHPIILGITPTVAISASLIAQNQIGCVDTAVVTWQVNRPFGNLSYATNSVVCIPQFSTGNLGFIANNGYPTYSVSYGDSPGNPVWSTYTNTFTNVTHNYTIPGSYTTTLMVFDYAGCVDTRTLAVRAIGQPTSSIYLLNGVSKFCFAADFIVNSNSSIFTSSITGYSWGFATPSNSIVSPPTSLSSFSNIISASGIFTISLSVDVDGYCPSPSSQLTVSVVKPAASAIISPTMFCLGETISASVTVNGDVGTWQWFFGDNVPQPIRNNFPSTPTVVAYPYTIYPSTSSTGSTVAKLHYIALNNACDDFLVFNIQVIKLEADFKHQLEDYDHCLRESDVFINTTPNPLNLNLSYSWNFGDQITATGENAPHLYTFPGTFTVIMLAKDSQYGCQSTTVKGMTVFPLPTAQLRIDKTLSCPNATFEVQGSGSPGVSGYLTATLSPLSTGSNMNLAPSNSFVTNASALVNTIYTLNVTDENNCKSDPVFDTMFIQLPAPRVDWDTAVIIGQTTPLNAFLGNAFTYTWSPLITNLNCDTCIFPNPISNSMVDITYTVMVEDTLKCSIVKNTYKIKIIPKVSLDVPTAFTPNGDGVNDVIFPAGWGIKKLIYFKVFNRWGQQIFESNNLNVGWDGNFDGVPQNMETYVYQVSVETYLETEPTLFKTGTFKLIR